MLQANAFWDFSLAVYADESVKNQSLELQDKFGLNVNMLLLCRFLDWHNKALCDADCLALVEATSVNNEDLITLREKRKDSKGTLAYNAFLKEELAFEKQQQAMLIDTLNRRQIAPFQTSRNTASNVIVYCQNAFDEVPVALKNKMNLFIEATNSQIQNIEQP